MSWLEYRWIRKLVPLDPTLDVCKPSTSKGVAKCWLGGPCAGIDNDCSYINIE